MDPAAHQVVHEIVAKRHAVEHALDEAGFLAGIDVAKPEMSAVPGFPVLGVVFVRCDFP